MIKDFNVLSMTCSACTSHVEKEVKKLKGINSVSVMLLTNSMKVDFDENILSSNEICKVVTKLGYETTEKNSTLTSDNKSDSEVRDEESNKDNNQGSNLSNMKKRLITSVIFLIPLMYISMGTMLNLPIPNILNIEYNALINIFTQLLLLIPIVYVNRNYFIKGFKNLIKLSPNMDSLIAIGAFSSIAYGIIVIYKLIYATSNSDLMINIHQYIHEIYFESAATILTLITLGKYLETKAKSKTTDAIKKLVDLTPKKVVRLIDNVEEEVSTEEIRIDDILVIKPGGKTPIDGIVIEGESYVDESAITGESMPKHKVVGDEILSASINSSGILKIKATKVGEDTTISQIIKLVYEASNSKAKISKLADKVSSIFVPAIIIIAILTFIYWSLIAGESISLAISFAISVLVVSCPCALGIATPVAIMVGMRSRSFKRDIN